MKWLLVIALVVGVLWWLQRGRDRTPVQATQKATPPAPGIMRACSHCGVHMLEQDMVHGQRGHYCSTEHMNQSGDRGSRG